MSEKKVSTLKDILLRTSEACNVSPEDAKELNEEYGITIENTLLVAPVGAKLVLSRYCATPGNVVVITILELSERVLEFAAATDIPLQSINVMGIDDFKIGTEHNIPITAFNLLQQIRSYLFKTEHEGYIHYQQ